MKTNHCEQKDLMIYQLLPMYAGYRHGIFFSFLADRKNQ